MKFHPFKSLAYGPLGINGSQRIAMWYAEGSTENLIPSITEIERQANEYIEANLPTCINNFTGVEEARVIQNGEIESKLQITDKDVVAEITYPLTVINLKNDKVTNTEGFTTTVPLRFKKVYDLALEVLRAENRDPFLERKAIDLLALDPSIPLNGFEISCSKKTWFIPEIKEKFKDLVMVNYPFIKLVGTDYTMPENPYLMNHYQWNFNPNAKYKDMTVSINYLPDWWMDLNAHPNKNGLLLQTGSQQASRMLSWFCMQLWQFTYDIRFPVEIRIVDKETKKHDKLVFSFGTEVSVKNNQPARGNIGLNLKTDLQEEYSSEDFCKDTQNEVIINLRNKEKQSLFAYGIKETHAVDLTFECGKFVCDLGKATDIGYGASYGWQGKLPFCYSGTITTHGEEFAEESFPINTFQPNTFTYYLKPMKQIQTIDARIYYSDTPWDLSFRRMRPTETVMITLSLISNETYETSSFGTIEGEGQEANISLAIPFEMPAYKDYTYKVDAWLIDNEKKEDLTKIVGMYTGNWTAEWDKLKLADKIVFNIPEFRPAPKDDVEFFMYYLSLNNISKQLPGPELT